MFVCCSFVLSPPFIAQNIFYRRRRSIRRNTNVTKGGNVCIWKLCKSMRWSGLKRCVLQLRVKNALCELSPTSRWSLQMGFAIFSHTWDFRSFTDMLRIGTIQISRSWQGQQTTHLLLWKHILLRWFDQWGLSSESEISQQKASSVHHWPCQLGLWNCPIWIKKNQVAMQRSAKQSLVMLQTWTNSYSFIWLKMKSRIIMIIKK